ncbi:MAG: hypothetical protein LBL26_03865 [Peptococcaceae bacterium]|nr:hypothetical protein [Peptococcaceae bacterium]
MELVLNIISYLFLLICVGVMVFRVLPALIKTYQLKAPTKKQKSELPQLVQSFFSGETDNEAGRIFAKLIYLGYFQCLKTGNHGINFPDEKQYQGFVRYTTPEIAQSLRNVGDMLERYIV